MVNSKMKHLNDWKNYPYSNLLNEQGINPDLIADFDQDKIVNWEDCDPFDPTKQGWWSKVKKVVKKVYKTPSPVKIITKIISGPSAPSGGGSANGGSSNGGGGSSPTPSWAQPTPSPFIPSGGGGGGGSGGRGISYPAGYVGLLQPGDTRGGVIKTVGGSGGISPVYSNLGGLTGVLDTSGQGMSRLPTPTEKLLFGGGRGIQELGSPVLGGGVSKIQTGNIEDVIKKADQRKAYEWQKELEKKFAGERGAKEEIRIAELKEKLIEGGATTDVRILTDSKTGDKIKITTTINKKNERIYTTENLTTGEVTTRTFESVPGVSGRTFETGGISYEKGRQQTMEEIQAELYPASQMVDKSSPLNKFKPSSWGKLASAGYSKYFPGSEVKGAVEIKPYETNLQAEWSRMGGSSMAGAPTIIIPRISEEQMKEMISSVSDSKEKVFVKNLVNRKIKTISMNSIYKQYIKDTGRTDLVVKNGKLYEYKTNELATTVSDKIQKLVSNVFRVGSKKEIPMFTYTVTPGMETMQNFGPIMSPGETSLLVDTDSFKYNIPKNILNSDEFNYGLRKVPISEIKGIQKITLKYDYNLSDKDFNRKDLYLWNGKLYDEKSIDDAIKQAGYIEKGGQIVSAGIGLTSGWTGIGLGVAMGTGAAISGISSLATSALESQRDKKELGVSDAFQVGKAAGVGALLAMPVKAPVGTGSKFRDAINKAVYGYANWEKIDYPLTTTGVSPKIRGKIEEWDIKRQRQISSEENNIKRWAERGLQEVGVGAGKLMFSKDKREATTGLVLGSFLSADAKYVKPLQNIFMYGVAPVISGTQLVSTEEKQTGDYFISSIGLVPITGAASGKISSKFSKLQVYDVIPGLVREDLKGMRVTIDIGFDIKGTTKHLIYKKKSGSAETPGGGLPASLSKKDVTVKNIFETAIKEAKEETGITLKKENLELIDVVNTGIETQFVVRTKKPLSQKEIPTKITAEAKKEGIQEYKLIDEVVAYQRDMRRDVYTTPTYTGWNKLTGAIKQGIGFPTDVQLRQQDILALRRSKEIERYDKLDIKSKEKLRIKGEKFYKKEFPNEYKKMMEEQMFPVDLGKEFYLKNLGLSATTMRYVGKDFKTDFKAPKEKRIKSKEQILNKYNTVEGELNKLKFEQIGKEFFMRNFGETKVKQMQEKKIDFGERYYLLVNGVGNKLELQRLKLASETQISPFEASKMELINYQSGRQAVVARDTGGRFKKNIARSRINQQMSMTFLPHSRYRGTPSEIAKLVSNDYFSGTSLTPNQIMTVGELVGKGLDKKLNIDLSKANSWDIIVLDRNQKKILSGKSTRGEDVLFFTPPTRADILGEPTSALSYAGIGGIVDYELPRQLLGPGTPSGMIVETSIKKQAGVGEIGFTKKGSPYKDKHVTEIEAGLLPTSILTPSDTRIKVRFGKQTLDLRKAQVSENKILDIQEKINKEQMVDLVSREVDTKDIVLAKKRLNELNKKLEIEVRKRDLIKEPVKEKRVTIERTIKVENIPRAIKDLTLNQAKYEVSLLETSMGKLNNKQRIVAVKKRYNILMKEFINSQTVKVRKKTGVEFVMETPKPKRGEVIVKQKSIKNNVEAQMRKQMNEYEMAMKKNYEQISGYEAIGRGQRRISTKYKQPKQYPQKKYPTPGYKTPGYATPGYPDVGYPTKGYPTPTYPISGYPVSGYPTSPKYYPPSYGGGPSYEPPRITEQPIPEPELLVPPILRAKPKPKRKESLGPGYVIMSKPVGQDKFQQINKEPVSEKRAKDIGAYYVKTNLARTFQVRKTGKDAKRDFEFQYVPEGYYNKFQGEFRNFKIKAGKGYKFGQQFIQKSKYMLGTQQEKSQLQGFRKQQENFEKRMKKMTQNIMS